MRTCIIILFTILFLYSCSSKIDKYHEKKEVLEIKKDTFKINKIKIKTH